MCLPQQTGFGKAQTTPSHWRRVPLPGEVLCGKCRRVPEPQRYPARLRTVLDQSPVHLPLHAAKLPVQQPRALFSPVHHCIFLPFHLTELLSSIRSNNRRPNRFHTASTRPQAISIARRFDPLRSSVHFSRSVSRHLEYDYSLGPAPTPVCPVETQRPPRGETQASRSLLARPHPKSTTLCRPVRLPQHIRLPVLIQHRSDRKSSYQPARHFVSLTQLQISSAIRSSDLLSPSSRHTPQQDQRKILRVVANP